MNRRNAKGYTLAEVLLAMSIIGIVAAMTIPQLATGMQKKQAGAILSRAVNQIELGCQNMIQYENSKITDGSFIGTVTAISGVSPAKLAPFIGAADTDKDVDVTSISKYTVLPTSILAQPVFADNAAGAGDSITGVTTVTSLENATKLVALTGSLQNYRFQKFGADLLFPSSMNTSSAGGDPNYVVLQLLIDTNGINKKPNMYGKDVFEFHLTNSCKVVPYGLTSYKTDCPTKDARTCAARVVADGWKVEY